MNNFNLFTITSENIIVIPLAYNVLLFDLYVQKSKIICYNNCEILTDGFVDNLNKTIKELYLENNDYTFVLDFKNISTCNRKFSVFEGEEYVYNLVFVNVNTNYTSIKEKISSSISQLHEIETDNKCTLTKNTKLLKTIEKISIDNLYYSHIINIFNDCNAIIDCTESPIYLDSSGIYSNYYLKISNIFLYPKAYTYLAYKLAEYIVENNKFNNVDAIISTSKTGGIIATLVGMLLDKKVIHCLGIGPKNIANIETITEKIRINKNYFLVSDFVCLGTEIKIINTIVECLKAKIVGGLSIGTFINLDGSEIDENSPLFKIDALVNVKKAIPDFKVFTYKEEN